MSVLLLVRAVGVGVTATLVLKYGIGMPLGALLRALAVGHPLARVMMASWVPSLVAALVWMASGWLVARVNRARPMAATMAYAIFINIWSLPRSYTVVTNALEDVRFVPALISHGTEIVAATVGVLIGGWLANLGRPRIPVRVTPVL